MSDNADLLVKVYERMGEMHADLRTVLADHKDLKSRVRRLEMLWAKLTGIAAAVAIPFTLLLTYLRKKLA